MGNFFNQILKPFHIKPFGGSDYSDNGMGDKALSDQEQANALYKTQGQFGNQLLQQNAPLLTDYAGSEAPLSGEAANLPGELSNYATYSGIAGPGQGAGNPYSLLPYEQQQLNQQQDNINKGTTASAARLKAELGRMGIKEGDPAFSAAMQHLQQSHTDTLAQHNTDFMESSRHRRANAAQQLAQMQQGLAGFQHQTSQDRFGNTLNAANLGHSLTSGAAQGFEGSAQLKNNIGQQARQESTATGDFFQGLAGFGLGGGFGGGGTTGNVFGPGAVFGQSRQPWSEQLPKQSGAFQGPPEQTPNGSAGSLTPQPFALPSTNMFQPTRASHSFKTGFERQPFGGF